MRMSLFISLLLLVLLTQCSREDVVLSPRITNLLGTWRLVDPALSSSVTLQFAYDTANPPHDVTPFLVSGTSSVNEFDIRFFAAIDGMMTTSNLSSTYKSGSAQAMQFEQDYFTNLKAVVRYEQPTENQLKLYHGGSQPHVLVYERIQ